MDAREADASNDAAVTVGRFTSIEGFAIEHPTGRYMSDYNQYLVSLMRRVREGDQQAAPEFAILLAAEGQVLLDWGMPRDQWERHNRFWIQSITLTVSDPGFVIPAHSAEWIMEQWKRRMHAWIDHLQCDRVAAVNFQRGIQSAPHSRWHDLEIGVASQPADGLSGDVYHHSETPGGYTVALLDSMGHGSPAGLHAVHTLGLLRSRLHESSSRLLSALNEAMIRYRVNTEYASLLLARFDSDSHVVTLANAGGVPPILIANDTPRVIVGGSYAPGMLPVIKGGETVETLPPGGVILLLSDGICPDFEPTAVGCAILPILHEPADRIAQALLDSKAVADDDQTAIVIKRRSTLLTG